MSEDLHATAERLVLQEHVEGISTEERAWLDQHLESCVDCARLANRTAGALRSLRAVSIPVPAGLADRAQLRAYLRAEQLRERTRDAWTMWVVCGIAWVLGIVSAPVIWRGFEWAGRLAGLPSLVWQAGFVVWWTVPALVAAIVLLQRFGAAGQRERMR
ncbi:MAG TPA: hypothetical protein VMH80_03105 [Bryobacteraceae bacterium]|nr:hypothetical protein [Bryobacteraceae bacterium]